MSRNAWLAKFVPLRLQFRLRTLLVLVALAAIPAKIASLLNEYQAEQRLLAEIGATIPDERPRSPFL